MKQTTTESGQPAPDETIKETFESIIIAFILAFVFRAYVVEAFVIPTGSMAPTLLGAHHRAECDQCGYQFKINFFRVYSRRGQYHRQKSQKKKAVTFLNHATAYYHVVSVKRYTCM